MDPNLLATIITVGGGGIIAFIVAVAKRGKPGLSDNTDDPETLVDRVAKGKTYGPEALVAMARMLTDQGARITVLERDERRYLERISAVEQWGMWSQDPPPRQPPEWVNDPRTP
jgi:hypothetical protein